MYAEKGRLELVHIVRTKLKRFLRSNPNAATSDNLKTLSISPALLRRAKNDVRILFGLRAFRACRRLYETFLKDLQGRGEIIIAVDGHLWTPRQWVVDGVSPHRDTIRKAAKKFSIDPLLLGAIIVDEFARYSALDFLFDVPLALVGMDTSVGVAQVTMKTARDVMRNGYYNPNPRDPKLDSKIIQQTSNAHLYQYVADPVHNIHLAAGRMRQMIDYWSRALDLRDHPEVIATLYSRGLGVPKTNPQTSDRGEQIMCEFYPLFRDILSNE